MLAASAAKTTPLRTATASSRRTKLAAASLSIWRNASARTATVTVCVPALPPIEATMGISTASATSRSMVASKSPITAEATTAVSRLINSHEVRPCIVSQRLERTLESPTPASAIRSSSASSSMTSMTSSMVITPISRPCSSVTGALTMP